MDLVALQEKLRSSTEAQISLTQEECKLLAAAPAPPTDPVSLTLKYKQGTVRIGDLDLSAITVAFLANEAIAKWFSRLDVNFSFYNEKEYKYAVSDA